MVQYIRNLEKVPGFSNIPLPKHETLKAMDKVLIDPVTGSKNFMLLWATFEPGTWGDLHTHPVEQAYFILSGVLKVRIAGEEFLAEANSAVYIPAGVEHQGGPVGNKPVCSLIIFSPPVDSFAHSPH